MRAGMGWGWKVLAVLAVAAPWGMWGQVQVRPAAFVGVDAAGNATTVEAALRTMTTQAAVAFVGTVTGIRRVGGDGFAATAGVVEVRFAVERGIRGVVDGDGYTLREWGGLWAANAQRYTVGARLLMLLHAPGATGLSSPVGGMDGAIPVKGTSPLVAAEDRTEATNMPVADLRWVAARLAHTITFSQRTGGTVSAVRGHVVRAAVAGTAVQGTAKPMTAANEAVLLADNSVPVAQASVATVLEMMAGWQKETADAR